MVCLWNNCLLVGCSLLFTNQHVCDKLWADGVSFSFFDGLCLLFARSSKLQDWLNEDDDGSNFSWLGEHFFRFYSHSHRHLIFHNLVSVSVNLHFWRIGYITSSLCITCWDLHFFIYLYVTERWLTNFQARHIVMFSCVCSVYGVVPVAAVLF